MKQFNRISFPTILAIAMALFSPMHASAQYLKSEKNKMNLRKAVHLNLGMCNVEEIAKELTAQTGTVVKVESYLKLHKLFISIDGMTSSDALSSIASMYHWRWFENDKLEIFISHKRTNILKNQNEFTNVLRDIFPVSWKTFIGDDFDFNQMLTEKELDDSRIIEEEINLSPDKSSVASEKLAIEQNKRRAACFNIYRRFSASSGREPILKSAFPTIPNSLKLDLTLPYRYWTEQEKRSILKCTVMDLFSNLRLASILNDELLKGQIRDYLLHPENATLLIRGGGLDIGQMVITPDGQKHYTSTGYSLEFLEKKDD